jgi:hypothetical protein
VFAICLLFFISLKGQIITYTDVKPIFKAKCASCHRVGDAAPFTLTSYNDIRKRGQFIKHVIETGYMPPWRADIHYTDFANSRQLTNAEKQKILKWIAANMPAGKDADKEDSVLTAVTAYKRKPDLTLKTDSAFVVKGDNTERFVLFKIPFESDDARNVEAIEFYCNNKRIVHHINYGFYDVQDPAIDIYAGDKTIVVDDQRVQVKQYDQFQKKMIYYTGWIPGASVESYPKNIGWVLPKRGVLLLTAHYTASGTDVSSITGVNLFFRKEPVKREVRVVSFGSSGIGEESITPQFLIIPNRISTFHLAVQTVEDQSVLYVWPHMHLIGKAFVAYAVTPARDTIRLVHIPEWDFRWQELYRFKKPVKIPKGSVVHLDCVYDNTAANPFNPNRPPKAVYSFGDMLSTNEMMTLLMIYLPYEKGDEQIDLRELPAAASYSTLKKK